MQVDVYTPLRDVLDQAWTLWELTILAQPLLIIAPSPGEQCSLSTPMCIAVTSTQLHDCVVQAPVFTRSTNYTKQAAVVIAGLLAWRRWW